MTLTLSMPASYCDLSSEPVFKSVRSARPAATSRKPVTTRLHLEPAKTAKSENWIAEKTTLEVIAELFWGRRNIVGDVRTPKSYRTSLLWQAFATLPLFPPLGFLVILANTCFGLRPKATRIGFIASLLMGALAASNTWLADTPTLLAALR